MEINLESILPDYLEIKQRSSSRLLVKHVDGRGITEIPSKVKLNREFSWMIGVWTGDNFSSKMGSVIRKGKRSSGRFGIVNNDKHLIKRFLKGLKSELNVERIKIDVQIPRNFELNKTKDQEETEKEFDIQLKDINVYKSSPWRKNVGYAVYTNDTNLLRVIYSGIYENLLEFIRRRYLDIGAFLQGLADSDGTVDKLNQNIRIISKDDYIVKLIALSLEKLEIPFKKRMDKRKRFNFKIKEINDFQRKVNFSAPKKKKILEEMIEGNLMRDKDRKYLEIFSKDLKKGSTAKDIHKKFGIPHSTVKLVLRNLSTGNIVKRKKYGRKYVYYIP